MPYLPRPDLVSVCCNAEVEDWIDESDIGMADEHVCTKCGKHNCKVKEAAND